MLAGLLPQRTRKRQRQGRRGARRSRPGRGSTHGGHGSGHARSPSSASRTSGIVFLDEIDKIAGREGGARARRLTRGRPARHPAHRRGHDGEHQVRHRARRTTSCSSPPALFMSPSPRTSSPSCRAAFPIRVELEPLTGDDFVRILTEPRELAGQAVHRAARDRGLKLEFRPDAIEEMARLRPGQRRTENIGARRLHTVMEKVLDEISFHAPDLVKSPMASSRFAA